nr:unnamed protein product [Callosobruchus analis]
MAVLPVSTSTNERSFSISRRLRTCLRSAIKGDRLNGLASLNMHPNLELNVDSILNDFFCTSTNCAIETATESYFSHLDWKISLEKVLVHSVPLNKNRVRLTILR